MTYAGLPHWSMQLSGPRNDRGPIKGTTPQKQQCRCSLSTPLHCLGGQSNGLRPSGHWCGRGKRDYCGALLRAALGRTAQDISLHGFMWSMRHCRALIASISEEYNEGAWADLVGQCEEAGVDGFELNLSCPQGLPERGMGMAIGQDDDKVAVRQPLSHQPFAFYMSPLFAGGQHHSTMETIPFWNSRQLLASEPVKLS